MIDPIKIMLVDDQILFREAIRTLLNLEETIQVVAEASDGAEALEMILQHRPKVVLMDLRMPYMNGIEATRRIRATHPEVEILVLTTFDKEDEIFDALRAGANGYVLKNAPAAQLVQAIRTVASGQTYLQPSVTKQVVAEFTRLSQMAPLSSEQQRIVGNLSARELEIVRLLTRASSNKEIANALSLTEGTVKNHMTNIMAKLGASDRTGAALRARDLGF
jgi:DNA-binding NarL/FixJ family response regulator